MKLKIADNLALPIDAATQTFAFIARKGAGKTYAAGKLCELLLEAQVQCVILDTVGNWYGLRLLADGKTPSPFDIPVVGGLRGDIPLEVTGGELMADIVVDTGKSLILDVSQFGAIGVGKGSGERQRFAAAFGERLWRRKKAESHPVPLMLVLEESQLVVPQNVTGETARMVGIYEEIVRLGRNYGIGCTMISQRPQSVNKEVLNQTECLFVGQVNGAQERDALKKWVAYQGMSASLVDELPSLPVGTMYAWSPQWLNILQKVKVAPKITYDASATPKVGEKRVVRELKPLDLDELKQKMASTIERAKADDPRELKKRIAELQRQVSAKAPAQIDDSAIQRAVERAVSQRDSEHKSELANYTALVEKLQRVLTTVGATVAPYTSLELPKHEHKPISIEVARPVKREWQPPTSRPPKTYDRQEGGKLRAGAERMLAALVQWHPEAMRQGQMRAHAGMKKSGTFSTYLSDLRTGGYIEENGDTLRATQAGIDYFGGDLPDAPQTTEEVLAVWEPKLREGARRILRVLVSRKGNSVDLETLADASGMTKSGTFSTYLSDLRTARLIVTERGCARANTETLFL